MTEFDDVIRLLRDGRPQATELELDEIKQRIRRHAADPSRRSQSMKSRFAILGMLVAGMLFSTAGAGLAMSGIASSGSSAATSQYAAETPTAAPTAEGGVLPAEDSNAPASEAAPASGTAPASETTPATGGGALPAEDSDIQPARQVAAAAETSQLPFTGFAAIPVLLGGLALLAGGLVLRRRAHAE